MPAAPYDFQADRWDDFVRTVAFLDEDLSAASAIEMQIRRYGDESGAPLINLAKVSTAVQGVRIAYSGTDTVANHILAGHLNGVPDGYDLTTSVFVTQFEIRIDAANVKTLPFPDELQTGQRGDIAQLAHGLRVTLGGVSETWLRGKFLVIPGAAQ